MPMSPSPGFSTGQSLRSKWIGNQADPDRLTLTSSKPALVSKFLADCTAWKAVRSGQDQVDRRSGDRLRAGRYYLRVGEALTKDKKSNAGCLFDAVAIVVYDDDCCTGRGRTTGLCGRKVKVLVGRKEAEEEKKKETRGSDLKRLAAQADGIRTARDRVGRRPVTSITNGAVQCTLFLPES